MTPLLPTAAPWDRGVTCAATLTHSGIPFFTLQPLSTVDPSRKVTGASRHMAFPESPILSQTDCPPYLFPQFYPQKNAVCSLPFLHPHPRWGSVTNAEGQGRRRHRQARDSAQCSPPSSGAGARVSCSSFREQGVVGLDGPREQREAGSCPSHRGSEWLELLLCVLVQDTANW